MSITLKCRTKKMIRETSRYNRQLSGSQRRRQGKWERERGRAGSERDGGEGEQLSDSKRRDKDKPYGRSQEGVASKERPFSARPAGSSVRNHHSSV